MAQSSLRMLKKLQVFSHIPCNVFTFIHAKYLLSLSHVLPLTPVSSWAYLLMGLF